MSQWTHIRGVIQLTSSPYEQKKFDLVCPKRENFSSEDEYQKAREKWRTAFYKSVYLPFPEEQFKLNMPLLGSSYGKKKKDGSREERATLDFNAYIYSLPRAKKYIEEAFDLLADKLGRRDVRHSVDQNCNDGTSSCSGFLHSCLYKYYKDAITKMYHFDNYYDSYTYEDLKKYLHIKPECHTEMIDKILVGVQDDMRCCSGEQVLAGLEEFFKYLKDHDVQIAEGYLEWRDDYYPEFRYAWRKERYENKIYMKFMKLDALSNKMLKAKIYRYKCNADGSRDWDATDFDIDTVEFDE